MRLKPAALRSRVKHSTTALPIIRYVHNEDTDRDFLGMIKGQITAPYQFKKEQKYVQCVYIV